MGTGYPYDVPASPLRAKDRAMATDIPIEDVDVVTARDRTVDGPKASPKGIRILRRTPRGTPKSVTFAKDGRPDRSTSVAAEPTEPKSIDQQNCEKDAGGNGDAPAASASVDKTVAEFGDTFEVDEFIDHHVDQETSTVDIQVKWKDGETTWETEWGLQEQVPTLVFKYWDKLEGRKAATGLDNYHVFKILKRASLPGKPKNAQYMYQVQWVGYRRTDSTWEHESKLQEIAPRELEEFKAKELASGAAGSQKRKNTLGSGRPRKKAKV
ncbi:hypothetical protein FALCPG4_015739 [Fusarium falciforme]